jgi:hypothetical protein
MLILWTTAIEASRFATDETGWFDDVASGGCIVASRVSSCTIGSSH